MKTLNDFFNSNKHVITWTIMYVFIMWAVLSGVFNFNMFSSAHWQKMLTVQLHGFPGLVLGLLILSSVPIYIATTIVTARNKSLPINIPLPKCFYPEPEKKPEQKPVEEDIYTELAPLPAGVPMEMREKFMHARQNTGEVPRHCSVFNQPMAIKNPIGAASTVNASEKFETKKSETNEKSDFDSSDIPSFQDSDTGLPLPSDFDFDDSETSHDFIPVFSDIDFGDGNDSDDSVKSDTKSNEKTNTDTFFEYARTVNKNATMDGNLVICGDTAVAIHDDDDFWVADEIDWFASGKQKPSPIAELKAAKSEKNKQPVLYLESSNIMDIEKLIPTWESDGIRVVTTLDEITKIISE